MKRNADHDKKDRIITTTCSYDCGGRCLLKVRVRDEKIVDIRTEDRRGLHVKACPRGLAQKDVVYHPDRLTRPMKRVGARGEGHFKAISWEEALETITEKIRSATSRFGTESLYFVTNTGSMSTLHHTPTVTQRFFGLLGKCTTTWADPSCEGADQSALATFGTTATGSSRENLLSSKLIVLWGWNPLDTRFGPDTAPLLSRAKKAGARIVCVDPRESRTCRALGAEWIPVKPGTDAAALIAMAHVMISEGLLDAPFIEKHTHGFDAFRDYATGKTDGTPKTPEWAQSICGAPAESIAELARAYAMDKPASLIAGWAPGRTEYGEQFHREASTLCAITGNIGVDGGHAGGGSDCIDMGVIDQALPIPETRHHEIHFTGLYDAILNEKSKGGRPDCKLLYIVGCNLLNQNLNLNKGKRALEKADFIVTHELFLTPTAGYADIVLPVTHFFEREDIGLPFIGGPYCIYMNKVLAPPPAVKSDLEIFTELAERLGVENYNDRSEEEWLETFVDSQPGFPDLDTLKSNAVHRFELERPIVAFREQIEDSEKNPFPTPSGRIEISSRLFSERNDPSIPPIPMYIPPREASQGPLAETHPIQLISPHSGVRANSLFDNIETIKTRADDDLWLNPADARRRGVQNGDSVYVYNQQGRMRVKAKVTPRIMPGVASIDQGQWHAPDGQGVEVGGSANVLTTDRMSPAGAFPSNTCLVQIEKCSD